MKFELGRKYGNEEGSELYMYRGNNDKNDNICMVYNDILNNIYKDSNNKLDKLYI
jgi:hypothetical protein